MAEPQSWLQSLGFDTILRALVPIGTAAVAAWSAWKFGGREQVQENREERIQRELDDRQAAISKRDAEAFDRLRDENDRCRKRIVEIEAQRGSAYQERDEAYQERDAVLDIARAWKERAHQLKHDLDSSRTIANLALIQSGREPRVWPDEILPALDQIIEDNALRMAKRQSIYGRHPPDDTSDG